MRPLLLSRAGRALLAPFALAVVAACSSAPVEEEVGSDDANLDYRSTAGKEFDLATDVTITLTGDDAALTGEARKTKASALAQAKITTITRALDAELLRIWPEDRRTNEKNIVAMIRMSTPAGDALRETGDAFEFTYRAQVAGPNDLLDLLPLTRDGEKRSQKLTVEGQELVLAWSAAAVTADSYPKYAEMFEDGLDIAIHVGGDHYDPRNDLNESRAIYDDLLTMGLRSPVAKFEDLKLDSGPLAGSMTVAGKQVAIRATLVHADMAPDDQLDKLVQAYKTNAKNADIVIYRGHAGVQLDYSGIAVHYNPRVAIPTTEFKNIDLPEKYQLFVYDGCETYTGYADKLYEHPKKDEKNADVITSVNFGSSLVKAESVRALLHSIIDKTGTQWVPRSWDSVLKRLNDAQRGPWTSIYGVHGLADNPKLSMLAKPENIGKACSKNADCGGADTVCVTTGNGKVCGAACTDDSACTNNTKCLAVRSASLGNIKQCMPAR